MKFFNPTRKKLFIAIILTVWPYVASLFFVWHAHEGNVFTDPITRLSFWYHSWYWSPLYIIVKQIPGAESNHFWQSNVFNFFVYPVVRFSIRYIVACAIVYYANKVTKKYSRSKHQAFSHASE